MIIAACDLMEIMGYDPKMLLVDVRTEEEFDAGHIPGAGNLPVETLCDCLYDEALAEAGLDAIANARGMECSDDASIIVFCSDTGSKAEEAVIHMEALGYTNVHMAEALDEWPYEFVTTSEEASERAADAAIAEDDAEFECECGHHHA